MHHNSIGIRNKDYMYVRFLRDITDDGAPQAGAYKLDVTWHPSERPRSCAMALGRASRTSCQMA